MRLFDADPTLLDGVPAATANRLRPVTVRRLCVTPGPWDAAASPGGPTALGLVVLGGLVERRASDGTGEFSEVLGPRDLLRPAELVGTGRVRWHVHERLQLAVLDELLAGPAAQAPQLVINLMLRATHRADALAAQAAAGQMRGAHERVLLVLRQLAGRFGRSAPAGTRVPLALTEDLLARLACLRRPTASTALTQLRREGRVERLEDRTWLLCGWWLQAGASAGAAAAASR